MLPSGCCEENLLVLVRKEFCVLGLLQCQAEQLFPAHLCTSTQPHGTTMAPFRGNLGILESKAAQVYRQLYSWAAGLIAPQK